MKIHEIGPGSPVLSAGKSPGMGEKDLNKAALDFSAILYEKIVTGMMTAQVGEKQVTDGFWWDIFAREVAREMAQSTPQLVQQIYGELKRAESGEKPG